MHIGVKNCSVAQKKEAFVSFDDYSETFISFRHLTNFVERLRSIYFLRLKSNSSQMI